MTISSPQSFNREEGRLDKDFDQCNDKSKKRKVQHLLESGHEKLTYAAQLALRASGQRTASKMVKQVGSSSSNLIFVASTSENTGNKHIRSFSPEEVLALFVDCKLTKASYFILRQKAREVGHNIYPPYYRLQRAKKECVVSEESVIVTESRVELPLQALLDLTVRRLCEVQKDALKQMIDLGCLEFTLFSKWGCDGSGGHSSYKQKSIGKSNNDENLFMFSLVPIHMRASNTDMYAWKNNVPGSSRSCRPIKFVYEKETLVCIKTETYQTREQILALTPTNVVIDGQHNISVKHKLVLTMVDGKVINALTDTMSTLKCFIYQATSKQWNVGQPLPSAINDSYTFGLSALHSWIRMFEFLLNISYRLEIKQKTMKSSEDRQTKLLKKTKVQEEFKIRLGLNLDKPKHGFDNTNDGNTARRFFQNSTIAASITGLDETLIIRFKVVLQILSLGYEIDVDKFENYVEQTKKHLAQLYPWYEMTPTVHKVLDHGGQIIRHHLVPIGQLNEEAQEARNKDFRRFRESNTRKDARPHTNRDLLTMLLVSSDPIVVSYRKPLKKKQSFFDKDVLDLLECTIPNIRMQSLALQHESADSDSSEETYSGKEDSAESDL